jgi:hypothetical protein
VYGITVEEYYTMVEAQDGRCLTCDRETTLVVDHDHASGVVRGLLCNNCNLALGHANDDPARLRRMAKYLERA